MKKRFCLIGLGKIGENLAMSLYKKKIDFDIWDINKKKLNYLCKKFKKRPIRSFRSYLKRRNLILILFLPHAKVSEFIRKNEKNLKKNDVLLDFGNSNPNNTLIRHNYFKKKGILFMGIGFSGGVKGARNRPCLMISGTNKDIKKISKIINIIINRKYSNKIKVIGTDPRLGHLSKICHNAIEYALMKLLGEFYIFQKNILKKSKNKIFKNYQQLNLKNPNFYLGQLSQKILEMEKNNSINLRLFSDKIEHNETSKWFNILCLQNNISCPTLLSSFENRLLSQNPKKIFLSNRIKKNKNINIKKYIELFLFLFLLCYIQGLYALIAICKNKKIKIKFTSLLNVWKSDSIITSKQIDEINKKLNINKIYKFNHFSNIKIKIYNDRLINLIQIFLTYNENPSGLFSCYNWFNSQDRKKKYENIFIQVLRNMFGNHKVKIN